MKLGVYVHLAFCPYLCPYCDFAKWPYRAGAASRYLDALRAELATVPRDAAATIFVGGGTPNAYDAATLCDLIDDVSAHFPDEGPGRRELTVELNPELVREGDFARYAASGVTRLSIGIQSFDRSEIAMLGRHHTPEQVAQAVRWAREAGVATVSLDLMFAVPGQTVESWRASLERAVALDVDHISAYGLTIEEGTPYAARFARDPGAFPGEELEAALYEVAIETLGAAGYEHYEISNFARPGRRCAHNENYWANGEYAGLGVGAASYRRGVRSAHTRDLERYVAAALAGDPIPGETEHLDATRRAGEAIMLALRTAQGVTLEPFKQRYGVDVLERYAPAVRRLTTEGVLEVGDGGMRLTRRGRFLANVVCAEFLEVPAFT